MLEQILNPETVILNLDQEIEILTLKPGDRDTKPEPWVIDTKHVPGDLDTKPVPGDLDTKL